MSRCGNHQIQKKIQEHLQKLGFPEVVPPNYVKKIKIPNNPYCSSITGKYVFDTSKISNFKVYFWKSSDNPSINPAIDEELKYASASAVDWPNSFKKLTKIGIDSSANLFGGTTTIVNTYDESDWVCVLIDKSDFLGLCYGPESIYTNPMYVDGRVVFVLNNQNLTDENLMPGSYNFVTLIHEAGHGFGLAHPHDDGFGSTIMPAIYNEANRGYSAIAAYTQNTIFTTIMSYMDQQYFLPEYANNKDTSTGYSFTLMPLDIAALKWMYNIGSVSNDYADKYSLKVIKISRGVNNQTQIIIGKNRKITFSNSCGEISFYFTKNNFSYDNLSPIDSTYNRVLGRDWSFYPMDTDASVSKLVLGNTREGYIFVEKEGIRDDVVVEVKCENCKIYVNNVRTAYDFNSDLSFTEKKTGKKFTVKIVNPSSNVKIYFSN